MLMIGNYRICSFGSWDEEFDHDFHTFEGIEYANEKPNITIKLSEFLKIIQETN